MIFELSISVGCSVDCKFCPQAKTSANYSGPRLMSAETFLTCIDKVPEGVTVSFAGYAEPYFNKRCTDFILYAAQKHPVLLYTTCVGMNARDVERLSGVKFQILCLHLPDADGNAKINVTSDYLHVVRSFIASHPYADLMAMGAVHPALNDLDVKQKWMHTRAGNVGEAPIYHRGRIRCTQNAEQKDNVLLPDGSLALCCMDFGLRHLVGNLERQTDAEIYEGEAYQSIRRGMMDGSDLLCRTCEFADGAV